MDFASRCRSKSPRASWLKMVDVPQCSSCRLWTFEVPCAHRAEVLGHLDRGRAAPRVRPLRCLASPGLFCWTCACTRHQNHHHETVSQKREEWLARCDGCTRGSWRHSECPATDRATLALVVATRPAGYSRLHWGRGQSSCLSRAAAGGSHGEEAREVAEVVKLDEKVVMASRTTSPGPHSRASSRPPSFGSSPRRRRRRRRRSRMRRRRRRRPTRATVPTSSASWLFRALKAAAYRGHSPQVQLNGREWDERQVEDVWRCFEVCPV